MNMKFKSLTQFVDEADPKKFPVSICFRKTEEERWCMLREKLRRVNHKLKISDFARQSLIEMMDNVEKLIEQHENSKKGA